MFWFLEFDETDPIGRAYRRYLHRALVAGLVATVLAILVCVVGVPYIQTSYSYRGPIPADGVVKARQKVDAWYWGVFGWRQVRCGQYGHEGCPYILFIPLGDCLKD